MLRYLQGMRTVAKKKKKLNLTDSCTSIIIIIIIDIVAMCWQCTNAKSIVEFIANCLIIHEYIYNIYSMCICALCLSRMIQVHYAPTKATIRGGMRRGSSEEHGTWSVDRDAFAWLSGRN